MNIGPPNYRVCYATVDIAMTSKGNNREDVILVGQVLLKTEFRQFRLGLHASLPVFSHA